MRVRQIIWAIILVGLAVFPGLHCFISSDDSDGTPSPTGLLYVLDRANDSVYIYDNLNTITGSVSPDRTITGSNTDIQNSVALAVDYVRDILYVADNTAASQAILTFLPASTTTGDATPNRQYTGFTQADALYYDATNDILYLADIVSQAIYAWDDIATLPNNSGPTRTILLGYIPSTLAVDATHNILYVAQPLAQQVNLYSSASEISNLTNVILPTQSFTNSTTPFANMPGMAVNGLNNILYVSDSNSKSIEIFDNANSMSGPEAPPRELAGSSTGFTVNQGEVVLQNNTLYIIQSLTGIGIWGNANQVTGDTAPDRSLTIAPASQIVGIGIDLTRS